MTNKPNGPDTNVDSPTPSHPRPAAAAEADAVTDFLANVNHDIRIPVNGIIGSIDLLARTSLDAKQSQYVALAKQSCRHLTDIVNDVLELSALHAGRTKIRRSHFKLHDTVSAVVQLFQERARGQGISLFSIFHEDVPREVTGDKKRVRQILTNLLTHAIELTEAGDVSVEVSLLAQNEDAPLVRFEVNDSGAGIPPEHHDRLFEPFAPMDAPQSARRDGTGLGLAIAKALVEQMNGQIGVKTRPGQGNTISFSLLFESREAGCGDIAVPSSRRTSAYVPGAGKPQILIVEDNDLNSLVTQDLVLELGCIPTVARDGIEAIDMVKTKRFDLILMDCRMPKMDGYETTKRLRKMERAGDIPIVALTAYATEEDRTMALRAGMDAYITKPVTGQKLADEIRVFIPSLAPSASAREPEKQSI